MHELVKSEGEIGLPLSEVRVGNKPFSARLVRAVAALPQLRRL